MAIEESKRETGGKEEVSACVLCPAACGQRGLSYKVSAKSETLSALPPLWPKHLKERGPKAITTT